MSDVYTNHKGVIGNSFSIGASKISSYGSGEVLVGNNNVDFTSPSPNDVLRFNGTAWVPQALLGSFGYSLIDNKGVGYTSIGSSDYDTAFIRLKDFNHSVLTIKNDSQGSVVSAPFFGSIKFTKTMTSSGVITGVKVANSYNISVYKNSSYVGFLSANPSDPVGKYFYLEYGPGDVIEFDLNTMSGSVTLGTNLDGWSTTPLGPYWSANPSHFPYLELYDYNDRFNITSIGHKSGLDQLWIHNDTSYDIKFTGCLVYNTLNIGEYILEKGLTLILRYDGAGMWELISPKPYGSIRLNSYKFSLNSSNGAILSDPNTTLDKKFSKTNAPQIMSFGSLPFATDYFSVQIPCLMRVHFNTLGYSASANNTFVHSIKIERGTDVFSEKSSSPISPSSEECVFCVTENYLQPGDKVYLYVGVYNTTNTINTQSSVYINWVAK